MIGETIAVALGIAAMLLAAALIGIAIARAFWSYDEATERVTEGHRARILAFHPHGTHQSGDMSSERKRPKPRGAA